MVKVLGVWINPNLSFSRRVQSVSKACFVQSSGQYVTQEAALKAANALVNGWSDYCSLLGRSSLSCFNARKRQNVQNSLARIVTNKKCPKQLS